MKKIFLVSAIVVFGALVTMAFAGGDKCSKKEKKACAKACKEAKAEAKAESGSSVSISAVSEKKEGCSSATVKACCKHKAKASESEKTEPTAAPKTGTVN